MYGTEDAELDRPIAYALGSGSAKGFAHIGVLKVLEEHGVRPDLITGSSIGAIVGALYAAGIPASEIESIALDLDFRDVISVSDLAPMSAANGDRVVSFLVGLLPEDFQDLRTRFACVSTDLLTGERVVHDTGDVVEAIRSSIAVPGVFTPVERDGQLLADGGLTEPVPVHLAREMGAETVIAVSLSCLHSRNVLLPGSKRNGSLRSRLTTPGPRATQAWTAIEIMQRRIASSALAEADLVIEPDVRAYTQFAFLEAHALIELGEEAARAGLDRANLLYS